MPHIYLYIINFIDIIGSFTPIIFIMVHQRDHSIVMPISFRNRIRLDMNGEIINVKVTNERKHK